MIGEAGRWTDPLYSPGGDLSTIDTTVLTDDQAELDAKVGLYEQLQRAAYNAYVPSFAISYACLGDQEAYTLKYIWELTIYFGFYVFPVRPASPIASRSSWISTRPARTGQPPHDREQGDGGAPLFVPDPAAPGGGIVICQSFDAPRVASAFVVFDASHVSSGPIATIRMPSPVPPLFHSSFLPN